MLHISLLQTSQSSDIQLAHILKLHGRLDACTMNCVDDKIGSKNFDRLSACNMNDIDNDNWNDWNLYRLGTYNMERCRGRQLERRLKEEKKPMSLLYIVL